MLTHVEKLVRNVVFLHWTIVAWLLCGSSLPSILHAAEQVTDLQAFHHHGQTFLTWKELPAEILPATPSVPELRKLRERLTQNGVIRYRVYRSSRPIQTLDGLEPIAEVGPLSGWNLDVYGLKSKKKDRALRYVIKDGAAPLPPGVGLYVYSPPTAGEAYYAVTAVKKERENRSLASGNVLSKSVREETGLGVPILQRVERPHKFLFVKGDITLHYYVRWENPPYSSVPGKPFDYLVGIPPVLAEPAPVGLHLHSWGGSLTKGVGWWHNAEKGALFVSANQNPYDWWTGYHERYFDNLSMRDPEPWKQGVIRPYTQRRLLAFLDWVATRWKVDRRQMFVAGASMGGSGSAMLAIRYPEYFAWAKSKVGVHIPSMTPQFTNSYERVFGRQEWNLSFEDGTPVWDYFNDVWYLRQYPQKEMPLLIVSNGKNDKNIGWPQAVEFLRALQETKRAHIFTWGQKGHNQKPLMPLFWQGKLEKQGRLMPMDLRNDQSVPAFTHSSLDDNPGNGNPNDGAPVGQINAHLYWVPESIIDKPNRWEMTVGVGPAAPQGEAVVDVTPRRCQRFRLKPGEKVLWRNISMSNGDVVQSGEVIADSWGLVTLEKVKISEGLNRLIIWKDAEVS